MNHDTGQFTALTERIEAMDVPRTRGLIAATSAASRPELAHEVSALTSARRRARLQLIDGSRR